MARVIDDPGTLSKSVYIPSRHYAINRHVNIMSGCSVHGDGDSSVIDLYEGSGSLTFGKTGADSFQSCSLIQGCTLSSDANIGDRSLRLNDTSDIHSGDYLIITDTADGSFGNSRAYYRTSEVVRVLSVDGDVVRLYGALYGRYPATFSDGTSTTIANAPAYRIAVSHFTPSQYDVSDLKIVSHEHGGTLPDEYYSFAACGLIDSHFCNLTIENYGNDVAANICAGLRFTVERCRVRSYITYTTDAYALGIYHGQDFEVTDSTFRAVSHALATGGTSGLFCFNNRNFVYRRLTFDYYENTAGSMKIDLDVHANAENYRYVGIDAPHVCCDLGGYKATVEDCRFAHISSSFNCGGLTIRNCEVMQPASNLMWLNNSYLPYATRSIVVEGCVIHGNLTFDLQNGAVPYDSFVWRENVCGNILLTNGKCNSIIVEGNIVNGKVVYLKAESSHVSIRGNDIPNGYVLFASSSAEKKASGIIADNTICFDGVNPLGLDNYTMYLTAFDGIVTNNIIKCLLDTRMILVNKGSTVQFTDNVIHGGSYDDGRLMTNYIILGMDGVHVTFNRNVHNCSYGLSVYIADGNTAYAKQDVYEQFMDRAVKQINPVDSAGETVYFRDKNKMGYVSGAGAGKLCQQVVFDGAGAKMVENRLEKDKFYFLDFRYGGHKELFFCKTSVFSEEDALLVVDVAEVPNALFQAPDPSVYPYMYMRSDRAGGLAFTFYENRTLSDHDGAAFNVQRIGPTAQRPKGYDIYVGFVYYDTDLMLPVYALSVNRSDGSVVWDDQAQREIPVTGFSIYGSNVIREPGEYAYTIGNILPRNATEGIVSLTVDAGDYAVSVDSTNGFSLTADDIPDWMQTVWLVVTAAIADGSTVTERKSVSVGRAALPGAVDLGLPSGIMWADRNVGAESETDGGLYFSWGNTDGYSESSRHDFSETEYNDTPGREINGDIPLEQDVANRMLGEGWRIPTAGDFQELLDNCDCEWAGQDGVNGYRFTSRVNGNSVFFPASGDMKGRSLNDIGTAGRYWSASSYSGTGACYMYLSKTIRDPIRRSYYRYYGRTVRAVLKG
jgi:uncharacterized protein (TIGR02145 family)